MKKVFLILLSLMLMISVAFAEETPEVAEVDAEATEDYEDEWSTPPDPDLFSGVWVCGQYVADINWEEIGYKILIVFTKSNTETTEWDYSGIYDEEANVITTMPFGMRAEVVYDEGGVSIDYKSVYEDGNATFALDSNNELVWMDEKEGVGEDLRFKKIDFNGSINEIGKLFVNGVLNGMTNEEQNLMLQDIADIVNDAKEKNISVDDVIKELTDGETDPDRLNYFEKVSELYNGLENIQKEFGALGGE